VTPELDAVAVGGIAAITTFGLTYLVRKVALARGLVVQPDSERVHTRPTPTAGGAAMVLGFAVTLLIASQLGLFHSDFHLDATSIVGVVAAVGVIGLLGLVDDVRSVSPPAKVAGQVLAAMVLYFFGVTMTQIKVPLVSSFIVLGASMLPLVTALWVVGIANAVNLIDGLDGLAAGVVAIGSGSLCIYGLRLIDLGALAPNNIGPLVAAACCGICLGFLPHNFHRAKIFMGDTGAMALGLLMAAATMEIGGQASYVTSGETYFFIAPLVVPFVILAVPLFDTVLAVVRRAIRRTGVTERDLEHLHYRLMRLGHGHRPAVLLLWAWTLVMSALVLYPTFYPKWNAALPYAIGVLVVVLIAVFRPGLRQLSAGRNASRLPSGVAAANGGGSPRVQGSGGLVGPDSELPASALLAQPASSPGAPPAARGSRPGLDVEDEPVEHDEQVDAYRRAHRRRFARHHPPMRG
jgi:UDP-GlcNAc:undecaprenyl-phosphate GlcNAc-1-phosphate transferase